MNASNRSLAVLALSGLLMACQGGAAKQETVTASDYICDGDEKVTVSYYLDQEGGGYVKVEFADEVYELDNVVAGSGIKYSDGVHTWWGQGANGTLIVSDVVLLKNCVEATQ